VAGTDSARPGCVGPFHDVVHRHKPDQGQRTGHGEHAVAEGFQPRLIQLAAQALDDEAGDVPAAEVLLAGDEVAVPDGEPLPQAGLEVLL
jgi:hypothetical protein